MTIKEIIINEDPLIKTYDNFFCNEECNNIIDLSKNKLKQARVSTVAKKSVIRTGQNCFIEKNNKLAFKVIQKISKTIGLNEKHASNLQIVHYAKNQTYAYHYDSYAKNSFGKLITPSNMPYQRHLTAICYLNHVIRGGDTFFPKVNKIIKPEIGKMLVFSNILRNSVDRHPNSLHAGLPVYEGEKWICVLWFFLKKSKN